jgi:glycosyltransferase involved in cell wall biosynthesis
MRPKVSAVIAAYEERGNIVPCLRFLSAQTYSPIEVVVVDDGSRDGTSRAAARVPGVQVLRQAQSGAGAARNLGARHATADILAFVDADMVCAPAFIERLVAPMLERGAVGTFTKDIRPANTQRRWARAHLLARGHTMSSHFPPGFPDRWETFRAVWRSEFVRVGGFDEVGYGEDISLGQKLGVLAESAPGAACYHFEPDTLADIFRSARWYGRGERIKDDPNWSGGRPIWRRVVPFLAWATGTPVRERMPALFAYLLVWEVGVGYGWLTRHKGSVAN